MTAIARNRIPETSRAWAPATLACMGIVFGDIGTSPLYAFKEAAKAASLGGVVSPAAVLGIVSLIFWSLIVVISIKYAILIMRADNHGEGGILALLALISPRRARQSRRRAIMVTVGLVGAALLYGDGAITPAISVLSAIEGIKVDAPQLAILVVPLTVAILVLLFIIQRMGTSWIGGIFGPVMLVWFLVIGLLGLAGIARAPAILAALSPLPAINFMWSAGPLAFAVIGAAFLAVTGGEALYADMGHFGPFPIRLAWFGVALPALTLNYFGQGALLLIEPAAIDNPFYELAPESLHYGLVVPSDRRDNHRRSGNNLRRFFSDATGHSAGIPAAHEYHSHGGSRDGPNLYPARELEPRGREHRRGHRVRLLPRACWSLRHSGFAADGDHDAVGDIRRAALEA